MPHKAKKNNFRRHQTWNQFLLLLLLLLCVPMFPFFHLLSSVDVVFPLFWKNKVWQCSNSSSLRNERTKRSAYGWVLCLALLQRAVQYYCQISECGRLCVRQIHLIINSQLGIFVLQGVLENMLNVYFIYIYTVSRQFYPKQLANWNKSNSFVNKIRNMSQVY